MKKKIFIIGLAMAATFAISPGTQAIVGPGVTKTFTVQATVPAATGADITVHSVNSVGTPIFTPVTGTSLSFDPMTFNTANGIYLPNHYFAISVTPAGGAGNPNVSVNYTEGSNPNAAASAHGLGWKSTATFVKVTGPTTETVLPTHGKKLLKDIAGENINAPELGGGYLRVYLGIVTGDPNAQPPNPSGNEVFTNTDNPGAYGGTLTITTTTI